MKLQLTSLESRECPSFLGVRDGRVYMPDDSVLPDIFPDFPAAHYSAGDQYVTAFGADKGGGPRVRVFEEGAVIGDAFAYESSFRDGVLVAYENGTVATGTNVGGGPVVAVFDKFMNQTARFFAYDPDFRGGVSVAILNDVIYTIPGPGGGPALKAFTLDGTPIGAKFAADPDSRKGWNLIAGDATGDGIDDLTLAASDGNLSVVDGVTGFYAGFHLPHGYTMAGYEGQSLTVGQVAGYLRGRALNIFFDHFVIFDEIDAAAGSPNPPPTTGTRPGVYRPITTVTSGPPDLDDMETLQVVNVSGSVGTANVGTGSAYVPMKDAQGKEYIVTASHVARRSPFFGLDQVGTLSAPGRIDGVPELAGFPHSISTITPGVAYTVDAVAFEPRPQTTPSRLVAFGGETVVLDGVVHDPASGSLFVAIGRGKFAGTGTYFGRQAFTVPIKWPSGDIVSVADQHIAVGGVVRLAEPGFSGGVVFMATFVGNEQIRRDLVGMTVAGNATTVFITPHALIEQALNLSF